MAERTTASHRTPTSKRVEPEAAGRRAAPPGRIAEHPPEPAYLTGSLANSAVLRLLHGESQGRPLDPRLRRSMESRLGADLSRVRVHTGPRAAASADFLVARAYTIGHDIAFGPGEYRPAEPAGRDLLVHELSHAVQQTRGRATVGIARQAKEGEETVPAASDDSLGKFGDTLVEVLTQSVAGSGIQQRMLSAAVHGFVAELGRQVKAEEAVARMKASFRELLIPQNAARFAGGYTAGAAAGLVSPVTDLLGIFQLGEQLPQIGANLLRRAFAQSKKLGQEALDLAKSVQDFGAEAPGKLIALLKDPVKIYEAVESYGPKAVQAAGGAGREGARQIVGFFTAKEEKKEPQEGVLHALTTFTGEESLTHPVGLLMSKTERVRKAVFSTPWSDFGYKVGHAVGAVVSNLLLFIFSEGIGNAISKIAAGLGEVAPFLAGKLAKVGEVITAVEHAIAAALGAATKLVKPLEEVMGPLTRLLTRLRGFLRRLLGLAETEVAELAARGAGALAEQSGGKTAGAASVGEKGVPVKKPSAPAAGTTAVTAEATAETAATETAITETGATQTATTAEATAGEDVTAKAAEATPEATAKTTAAAPGESPTSAPPAPVAEPPAPNAPVVAPTRPAATAAEGEATGALADSAQKPAWLAEAGTPAGRARPPVSATTRRQQAALAKREPSVSPIRPPKRQAPPVLEPSVSPPVSEAATVEEAAEQSVERAVAESAEGTAAEEVVLEATTGAPVQRPTAMASGGRRGGGAKPPAGPPKRTARGTRGSGGTVTPIGRGRRPPKAPPSPTDAPTATQTTPGRPPKAPPSAAEAPTVTQATPDRPTQASPPVAEAPTPAQVAPERPPEAVPQPNAAQLQRANNLARLGRPPVVPWNRGGYSVVAGAPDPQLIEMARELRASQAGITLRDFSRTNIAVAKIRVGPPPGVIEYIDAGNVPAALLGGDLGFHSEGLLADQLARRPNAVVLELYSERVPCSYCRELLSGPRFSETAVFYSVPEVVELGGVSRGEDLMRKWGLDPR